MSSYNAVWSRNTKNAPVSPLSAQSVAFSHYNNLTAQLPIDPATGNLVSGGIKAQAQQCFENVKAIVESVNHVMSDVVRISVFVTNIKDVDAVDEVYKTFFPIYLPTRTTVAVASLPMDALVQVEALITCGEGSIPNAPQSGDLIKLTNNTDNAPVSALSTQIVSFSHYANVTAQLPIEPKSGRIVAVGVKEQAAQCLKNIKAILESVDVALDDIVRMTVFVKNLSDVDAVNEVYSTFFPDSAIARTVGYLPARTVVEVVALPMDALVQMEAVVSYGDGTPPQIIEDRHGIVIWARNTDNAPKDSLSTQTVAFSHYNHISAQLPVDATTGNVVAGGVKEQTAQCLTNLKAIVESIDHVLGDVVKVNVSLTNMADMSAMDEAYKAFFPEGTPARRVVGVATLTNGALVQLDAVVANAEGTPPSQPC